jgi:hypothetical protein
MARSQTCAFMMGLHASQNVINGVKNPKSYFSSPLIEFLLRMKARGFDHHRKRCLDMIDSIFQS